MSKVVDQRVVQMQFDNKQFESNVATTMSTLEKLKQKLNLSGASKGLSEINAAASKCDMTPLGNAVEGVRTKFSALEVMGVTALANITNSAVNAGKRIAAALTIDPVKTGLSEYETKINAIQVIKANTRGKNTMEEITAALQDLNDYADRTIYNYAQMTDNVGKFVAQGLDVNKASKAVQGLANLAGASGASATDMARATYQMSQALGGVIRKIDWNSLRNANMATVELKNTLMDIAKIEGIDVEALIEKKGTFEDTLEEGWLTGDLFTEAMNIYSNVYSEAELKAKGYTDAQVANFMDLAKMAEEATIEVKTLSQLYDVLKETAQSGWTQSWEFIIGDFDSAKSTLTEVQVAISGIIDTLSDWRNAILESAFATAIGDTVRKIMAPIEDINNAVETITDTLLDYSAVVDEIIGGKWGNGAERWQSLADAGYDWAHAQNLVNERLGDSTRHATDYVEGQGKLATSTAKSTKAIDKWTDAEYENLEALIAMNDEQLRTLGYNDEQIAALRELKSLADKLGLSVTDMLKNMDKINGRWLIFNGLKNIGKSLVEVFGAIGKAWKETFTGLTQDNIANTLFDIFAGFHRFSVKLLDTIEANSDNITRIFKGLFSIIHIGTKLISGPLKLAFTLFNKVLAAFDLDILSFTANIADLVVKFHDWFIENDLVTKGIEKLAELIAEGIKLVQAWVDEFKKLEDVQEFWTSFTDRIDNMTSKLKTWGGGFSDIFESFLNTLNSMNEITFEGVLDALIQLRDDILKHFGILPEAFRDLLVPIGQFGKKLLEHIGIYDEFDKIKTKIQGVVDAFKSWFKGLREADNPVEYIIDGIKKALDKLVTSIKDIWSKIKSGFTGDASDMDDSGKGIGKNLVLGIARGLWEGVKTVFLAIKTFCTTVIDIVKEMFGIHSPSVVFMTIGGFLVAGLVLGILNSVPSIGEALGKVGTYIAENFGNIISGIGEKLGNLFGKMDFSKLYGVFGSLATLMPKIGIFSPLSAIFRLFSTLGVTISDGTKTVVTETKEAAEKVGDGFSKVFDVIKNVVTRIVDFLRNHFDSIAAIIGGVGIALAAFKLTDVVDNLTEVLGAIPKGLKNMFESFGKAREMKAKAKLILSYAIGIGILAAALYYMAKLKWPDIARGVTVIAALGLVLGGLTFALNKLTTSKGATPEVLDQSAKNMRKMATVMIGIAASVAILAYAMTLLDDMGDDIWRNLGVVVILAAAIAGIAIGLSKFAPEMSKGSLAIIAISAAVLLMVLAMNKLNALTIDDPKQLITSLLILVAGLALVARASKGISGKATFGLIGMVIAIYIFIGLLKKIANMDTTLIEKSMGSLGKIMLIFAGLMLTTRLAGKNAKSAAKALISIGVALILTAFAIKLLGNMDEGALKTATDAVTQIMIIFGLIIALSKFAGKDAAKAGVMLIAAAAAILILVGAMAILASMKNVEGLDRAMKIVSWLLILFGGLIYVSKFASNAKGSLIAIAVTIGILVAAIGLLTLFDPQDLKRSVTALSALVLALSASVFILGKSGKVTDSAMEAAGKMVIVLIGIAAVLALCQLMGVDAALNNVAALGALLLVISAACFILSKSDGINAEAIVAALVMSVVLTVIAVALGICQLMQIDAALNNVAALGTLLLTIAGACWILSKAKWIDKSAIGAAFAMVAVLGIIALVLGLCQVMGVDAALNNVAALGALLLVISGACVILSYSGGIDNKAILAAMAMGIVLAEIAGVLALCQVMGVDAAFNNVVALSTLLIVLAVACNILDDVNSISPGAIVAVAALGLIVWELGFVLSKILEMNIGPCLGTVVSISAFLLAMTVITAILSKVQMDIGTALTGAVTVMLVIGVIGAMAGAIGWLMSLISPEKIEAWKVGLQSFMDFIVILATGLGEAIGGLVGGVLAGVGQGLSDFMTGLQGFIEGAKTIDPSMADGMKALGAAIIAITAASILDGLARWLGLGSMDELGASMASFGDCMVSFAQSISGLTEEDINRIKMAADAGKAMADMEASIPREGGWWQTIIGEKDMKSFGERMAAFGESMVTFFGSVSKLSEKNLEHIELAAEAGKAMADMESAIPKQDGWWQDVIGKKDAEDFGERMAAFGESMVKFSGSVDDLSEEDIEHIKLAVGAGTEMGNMESAIPRADGWWQDVIGKKDAEDFGERMVAFGDSLVKFADCVANLSATAEEDIGRSKAAAEALVEVADVMPDEDNWLDNLAGKSTDPGAFGETMARFAGGLSTYATAAGELSDTATDDIKASKSAVEALKEVAQVINGKGWNDSSVGNLDKIIPFGTAMASLIDSVKAYETAIGEGINTEAITNSKSAVEALKEVAQVVNGKGFENTKVGNISNIASFGSQMETLAGSLKEYSATVSEGISVTAIEDSKTAIVAMADAAKALPNEGGVAGFFAGENSDIAGFGKKMVELAGSVMNYATTVAEITPRDVATISFSAMAIAAMATAAKVLPNEGGLQGLLAGENSDIVGFGKKMVDLADCVMTYASKVSEITMDDVGAIIRSAWAISAMATAAKALPNEGGLQGLLAGENSDITGFGVKMVSLAGSLNQYLAAISGITEESVSQIFLSGRCVTSLSGVALRTNLLTAIGTTDVGAVSTNLLGIASMLVQYTSKIHGITEDTVTKITLSGNAVYALGSVASKATVLNYYATAVSDAAIAQLTKLVTLARGMVGIDFGYMGSFADALGQLGESGVTRFIAAFTDSYSQVSDAGGRMMEMLAQGVQNTSDRIIVAVSIVTGYMVNTLNDSVTMFYTCGVTLMMQFASGIVTGSDSAISATSGAISSIISMFSGTYDSAYDAGDDLVEGFAAGINGNTFKARAAAVAMAQTALNAAKAVLKINSPSKVFMGIGASIPEGFAMGIGDVSNMVNESVENMSNTALDGTRRAISKLVDYVNTDIDTQPTIRPVLDLSEVTSGVNSIGSIFDTNPSVGVLANVGVISSMMNTSRSGTNDDVVDAINKLGKGLGELDRNTYNVNGITYDDGSAMGEAVSAVIRAARIGGRV